MMILLVLVILATAASPSAVWAFCPQECHCQRENVSCGGGGLDIIPITLNPMMRRLSLKDNRIKIVDASLNFYTQLEEVDFSGNLMEALPDRGFFKQRKLLELRLDNNRIRNITNSTAFVGLQSLLRLSLKGNRLESIPSRVFDFLPKLERLDLRSNRISVVNESAFHGLRSVRSLLLDSNRLKVIPKLSDLKSGKLQHLGLSGNTLVSHLEDDAFRDLAVLRSLDLSFCAIANISQHAFRGLTNLEVLNLTGNSLVAIPSLQLMELVNLREFRIGDNLISVVPTGALPRLSNLEVLGMSDSTQLSSVEPYAFKLNPKLNSIDFSGSKNLQLQESALSMESTAIKVNLADAGIRSLLKTAFVNLAHIDLSGNPLVCDCNVVWLRNLTGTSAICEFPFERRGQPLESIPPSALQTCQQEEDNVVLVFRSIEDKVVLVSVCVVAAVITGVVIVGCVHCRQMQTSSSCMTASRSCDGAYYSSESSNSYYSSINHGYCQQFKHKMRQLCCCCRKNQPSSKLQSDQSCNSINCFSTNSSLPLSNVRRHEVRTCRDDTCSCYYSNNCAKFPQSQTTRSLVMLDEDDSDVRRGQRGNRSSHFDPLFTINQAQRSSLSMMTSSSSAVNTSNSSNSSRSTAAATAAGQKQLYYDNTYSSSLFPVHDSPFNQHAVSQEMHETGMLTVDPAAVWEVNPDASSYYHQVGARQLYPADQPITAPGASESSCSGEDFFISVSKGTVKPIHVSEL